jgi:hypothetical protein
VNYPGSVLLRLSTWHNQESWGKRGTQ